MARSVMTGELSAIVVAPRDRGPVITGLTLGERGRRVAVRAGVPAAHVHVVRAPEQIAAVAKAVAGRALVVIHARDQVVAGDLVEPLQLGEPGARKAVDARGDAGAIRVDAADVPAVLEALAADLGAPPSLAHAQAVTVGHRARHPASNPDEIRAANAWQWELVNKPLDAFLTRRFWRPCARPFTRLFLRLPFSPNQISFGCIALAILGGIVACGASYEIHLLGIAILFASALADNVDGEVARLRLQSSNIGGWLDTIGDDVSRVMILIGLGFHTRAQFPDLPIGWILIFTMVHSLITWAMLYWWCIFVGKTYNNQNYAKSLGLGPSVENKPKAGFGRLISELGIQLARRDFLDLAVTILAIVGLSWVSFAGLCLGQLIGFVVMVPLHFKIVAKRKQDALAATTS